MSNKRIVISRTNYGHFGEYIRCAVPTYASEDVIEHSFPTLEPHQPQAKESAKTAKRIISHGTTKVSPKSGQRSKKETSKALSMPSCLDDKQTKSAKVIPPTRGRQCCTDLIRILTCRPLNARCAGGRTLVLGLVDALRQHRDGLAHDGADVHGHGLFLHIGLDLDAERLGNGRTKLSPTTL